MSKAESEKNDVTKVGIQPADKAKNTSKTKDGVLVKDVSVNKTPVSERTEIGGRKGPEPTRYGDWEKNGRCIDF